MLGCMANSNRKSRYSSYNAVQKRRRSFEMLYCIYTMEIVRVRRRANALSRILPPLRGALVREGLNGNFGCLHRHDEVGSVDIVDADMPGKCWPLGPGPPGQTAMAISGPDSCVMVMTSFSDCRASFHHHDACRQMYAHCVQHSGCPTVWQQECYNGYKHMHALKYSAVKCPDGLLYHLAGPIRALKCPACPTRLPDGARATYIIQPGRAL
jgi:hypothetical protein